jgi:TrmH family RNA methyltransferase
MHAELISSPKNTQVKDLVRLHEGKHRRRQQRFIIEGQRELERALEAGIKPDAFYFSSEIQEKLPEKIEDKITKIGCPCYDLTQAAFQKASLRENPDGILAVAPIHWKKLEDISVGENPFLLVMERIEKPGNLGTLLRTADAAGVDLVIISEPIIDTSHPQVIRNSQGGVFGMPVTVATNEETLAWLEAKGIQMVATTPAATENLWNVDYKKPTAMFLGSEAYGLSDFWLESGKMIPISIPMAGLGDSLNVAAAAAISLFEVVRQRS